MEIIEGDLKLRVYPHKDLSQKCIPVTEDEFNTFELEVLCGKMISVMNAFESVALSANQVGVNKRIFVLQNLADDGVERDFPLPDIFINPEIIIDGNDETDINREMCISFPNCYPRVTRHKSFSLKFFDTLGKEYTIGPKYCTGLLGAAIQHEVDHLNGITFIENLDVMERQKIIKKVNKLRSKK